MINLFYLSKNTTGGWVTFTSHLARSLAAMDVACRLWKIGSRTETFSRDFGYGLTYTNVTIEDAAKMDDKLIVACAKQLADQAKVLLSKGTRIVIHDPTEVSSYLNPSDVKNPWVIRKANVDAVQGTFIRHPYVRQQVTHLGSPIKRKGCVSISRIDFDKHTDILLEANEYGAGIRIHGFENRLYTKFKLMPKYPYWEQSVSAYPRDHHAAFNILLGAKSMADMSLIKGDGGGTQYTTLEAWDAGTAVIVNTPWLRKGDDLVYGKNVDAAHNGESLALVVKQLNKDEGRRMNLVEAGYRALRRHEPKVIVPEILEWMGRK